jgi:DNA-binding HxlR family transcriptional regulator
MLGKSAVRVIDACLLKHPSTADLARIASSRTVDKTIQNLEELGVLARYPVKGVSAGRPKLHCGLTPAGLELKSILDEIRFRADYQRVERAGISVTVGLFRSMAEGYGAPLVTGYELAVPKQFREKARALVKWGDIEIEGIGLKGFAKRGVKAEGLRYLGLEDIIVLAAINKEDPARLQACATTLISDFAERVNYNLLLELALEAKVVNEVGGLLFLTNNLAGREVVHRGVLDKFLGRVVKRKVDRHLRYYILVAQGVSPSEAEHPVDAELREKWHARLPTFEECREVFGWRGVGKVG